MDPPVRGPFGEAEIWLKPDAIPIAVPPYRMNGERRDALDRLVGEAMATHKMEPGKGPWNTPVFPVPKKKPGEYRIVQDHRPQNACTVKDGHPLPRIHDVLHRQGKCLVWSVLDLVDGFHQMPLKKEHRHITCMSTPRGTMQWTVQVMGLKNAATQFQRMMEWVLKDIPEADAYIDDVIAGSEGATWEEAVRKDFEVVCRVLQRFAEVRIVCKAEKSHFFQREVEFCGHIGDPPLGNCCPFKVGSCLKQSLNCEVSLGLTNYFAEYVDHYAEVAAPFMGKLQLDRKAGKKGLSCDWIGAPTKSMHSSKLSASCAAIWNCGRWMSIGLFACSVMRAIMP